MYDALVFDMDGVLLRPHPEGRAAYEPAVEAALANADVDPDSDLVETLLGGTPETTRQACAEAGLDMESFWPIREEAVSHGQRRMLVRGERTLYDDATELEAFAEAHVLGLVSSNQQATADAVVDYFELDSFDEVLGRDPTVEGFERTKPRTYYLDRALDALGVSPADALYVGDSDCDVVAATDAGMDTVFLRRAHRTDYSLSQEPTDELTSLTAIRSLDRVGLD